MSQTQYPYIVVLEVTSRQLCPIFLNSLQVSQLASTITNYPSGNKIRGEKIDLFMFRCVALSKLLGENFVRKAGPERDVLTRDVSCCIRQVTLHHCSLLLLQLPAW